MSVEGGTRVVKYLLFIFNLLFLLAGLALMIIGAVATAKLTPYSNVAGVHFNGVGVFLIIIGFIVFAIAFFGCLGAYKENYCLLITFIVLMVITLLALIVAIIVAFVMKDKVNTWIEEGLNEMINEYNRTEIPTNLWNSIQKDWHCCGSEGPESWLRNAALNKTYSVPKSCCKDQNNCTTANQAKQQDISSPIYAAGCAKALIGLIFKNVVAVGGAAVAIAILMFIGILFAVCLAHGIRKHYQTV